MLGVNGCWRPAKASVHMSHNQLKCCCGGEKTIFSPAEKELQQVLLPVLGLVNRQSMLLPLQKTNIGINFHLSNKLGIMFSSAFTFVGSCL